MQTFHLFFSRCLRALLADLQKRWKTPEIEVVTFAYVPYQILSFIPSYCLLQLQNCFDNRNIDTSVSKMHIWKISEICNFGLKHDFYIYIYFSLKTLPFRMRVWKKRFSVSCSPCKGQHFKRKKKTFGKKNRVLTKKSQLSEIFQKCILAGYKSIDIRLLTENSFAVESTSKRIG